MDLQVPIGTAVLSFHHFIMLALTLRNFFICFRWPLCWGWPQMLLLRPGQWKRWIIFYFYGRSSLSQLDPFFQKDPHDLESFLLPKEWFVVRYDALNLYQDWLNKTSCHGQVTTYEMFKAKLLKMTSDIEKLHLKFCKRILGVNSKSTNLAVYAELGKVPLILQISTLVAKYWLRIKNPSYNNTLVGEAARFCIACKQQPVAFTNHLLQLCNVNALDVINVPLKK